jgi:hypothetical protein
LTAAGTASSTALHCLAVNQANWDLDTAAYVERNQAEGKSRKEALRCLKRHLARRGWKLLHAPPTPPRQAHEPRRPRAHSLAPVRRGVGVARIAVKAEDLTLSTRSPTFTLRLPSCMWA